MYSSRLELVEGPGGDLERETKASTYVGLNNRGRSVIGCAPFYYLFPQKISLRVWSSINNEYICCVARPMLVTEWPVVSRKSEREKR